MRDLTFPNCFSMLLNVLMNITGIYQYFQWIVGITPFIFGFMQLLLYGIAGNDFNGILGNNLAVALMNVYILAVNTSLFLYYQHLKQLSEENNGQQIRRLFAC